MAALAARCLGTICNHLRPAHGQQSSCLTVGCASQGEGSTSPAGCTVHGHHMQSSAAGARAAVVLPGRPAARAGACRLGPVRSHASEFSSPGGMGQSVCVLSAMMGAFHPIYDFFLFDHRVDPRFFHGS
ncbi:unnamed protein product [Prorocentrum cordatum]|uniref:Mannosyltransferase n=1 Tax=Prorocentrum cordatum TaxID=2364126 RepID=A0ABN9UTQ8_9DINO|nr:unnamed protein product [Polarella glacialis]CAK0863380.1 unnamed protein product [Polarella glacialis]